MQIVAIAAALFGMVAFTQAHMEMTNPPPLRSRNNKFAKNVDYDMTSPLSADGSNFPCRGSLGLLGTDEGKPVAEWVAGKQYSFTVDGSAFHGGGSCQASLSYDKGKTWTVIHSYVGKCPSAPGPTTYSFTVPADASAGEAVFAWTWFNQVGNREMYMNCAVVKVQASRSKKRRGIGMSSRPTMFEANVGNGCGTIEGKNLEFPDPGPSSDVTVDGGNVAPPSGKCATGNGNGNDNGGKGGKGDKVGPDGNGGGVDQGGKVDKGGNGNGGKVDKSGKGVEDGGERVKPTSSTVEQPKPTVAVKTSATPTLPGGVFATVTPSSSTATPVPTGTPGDESSAFAAGSSCKDLGSWNCIGGKQYQRCASGNMWSIAQPLARGTSCKPGVMKNIIIY